MNKETKKSTGVYPRTFSHVGISVTDINKAVDFYTKVFGAYVLMKPTIVTRDSSAIGKMCDDVFGDKWETFKIAHLSTGDKIGLEIFEFPDAKKRDNNFEYWYAGIFHLCFQDPDIEGLAEKIVEHGGKLRTGINYYYPEEKPFRMCYAEDPFGNIIELYSHSYELIYSKGAY